MGCIFNLVSENKTYADQLNNKVHRMALGMKQEPQLQYIMKYT